MSTDEIRTYVRAFETSLEMAGFLARTGNDELARMWDRTAVADAEEILYIASHMPEYCGPRGE